MSCARTGSNSFDWREQERYLNGFHHEIRRIDDANDIDVHYIHERGRGPDPIPLS